jgi:hypothetical protein
MSVVNERLMEDGRSSDAGLERLQATRTGGRRLVTATRARYTVVPGV